MNKKKTTIKFNLLEIQMRINLPCCPIKNAFPRRSLLNQNVGKTFKKSKILERNRTQSKITFQT